jgi:hypothetical protein
LANQEVHFTTSPRWTRCQRPVTFAEGRICLIECTTIDDLMLGRGQETPENHSPIVLRGFFYRFVGFHEHH